MIIECEQDRFINDVLMNKEYAFMFWYPIVLDIGCNIGAFSYWIYPFADIIYAVDIAKPNIEQLQKNIDVNKLVKIHPYNVAIGGGSGMSKYSTEGKASSGAWRLDDTGTEMIQTYSVKDFLSINSLDYVDLMKIDIEGNETAVFEARDFPYQRIGTIIGETHGGNWGSVRGNLEKFGYKWKGNEQYFVARRK